MVNDIKRLWTGLCFVSELKATENEEFGRMEMSEEILHENVPCLLVSTAKSASREDISSLCSDGILLVDRTLQIPEGSKIRVEQNGYIGEYAFSGIPKVFRSHREIPVSLFRKWV